MRRLLFCVAVLLMAGDYLGSNPLDDQGESTNYLGALVQNAFKQSALPTAGATGKAAGPAGVSGTGTIAGVAPSPGAGAGAAAKAPGTSDLARIARALGLSEQALKSSDEMRRLFGDDKGGAPLGSLDTSSSAQIPGLDQVSGGELAIGQDFPAIMPDPLTQASGGELALEGASAADTGATAAGAGIGAGGAAVGGAGLALAALNYAAQETGNKEAGTAARLGQYAPALAGLAGPVGALAAPAAAAATLAPYFKEWDRSHYNQVRNAAERQGAGEIGAIQAGYSQIPQGDLGTTYAALQTQLDPKNAVRSFFQAPEGMEGFTPGVHEWSAMSPEQFGSVMQWIGQDPSRLSAISGSGDVGYLAPSAANQFGGQAADAARALIARQLGLPYMSPRPAFDPGLQSSADAPAWWNQDVAQRQGVVNAEQQQYQNDLARWQAGRREDPSQPMTPESAVARALPADDFGPTAALVTGSGLRDREVWEGA